MLTTSRPTHSTVLYTVSTRSSAPSTLTSRLSAPLFLSLRILAGLLVTTTLILEYAPNAFIPASLSSPIEALQFSIASAPVRHFHQLLASILSLPWRLLLLSALTWLIFRRGYIEESLLVIRGLGVQTTTSSSNYLWSRSTRFIPTSSIQDTFIHEAFKGFEVRYYLCIVVEGEGDVVVVFPSILPGREVLEQVWRGTRACLYQSKP